MGKQIISTAVLLLLGLFAFSCNKVDLNFLHSNVKEIVIHLDESYDFTTSNQYGCSIALFGGSVAQLAYLCHDYWREVLNLELEVYAKASAGFTIEGNSILDQVERACSGETKYDMYLFWCSTNDYTCQAEVESHRHDYPYESQNDGIRACFNHIWECNPRAKIAFLSSMKCFDENGYQMREDNSVFTMYEYVLGQIGVCNFYSIPIFNQFSYYVFSIDNYQQFFRDYVHPNEVGYDLIKHSQALFIAQCF